MPLSKRNVRMCCVTRQRYDKQEMVKVTNVAGSWHYDKKYTMFGRSIYFKYDDNKVDKFENILKKKKISVDQINKIIEDIQNECR